MNRDYSDESLTVLDVVNGLLWYGIRGVALLAIGWALFIVGFSL